jgi:hypothetical protein
VRADGAGGRASGTLMIVVCLTANWYHNPGCRYRCRRTDRPGATRRCRMCRERPAVRRYHPAGAGTQTNIAPPARDPWEPGRDAPLGRLCATNHPPQRAAHPPHLCYH